MTPAEKTIAGLKARLARLSLCSVRRERPRWREDAIGVCAKAAVLHGDRAYRDRRILCGLWAPEQDRSWPPTVNTVAYMGGLKAIYDRIEKGGLGIDDKLGVWNGGFFHGLKMSCALLPHAARQWYVWERLHRELVLDMEGMHVSNRMERKAGRNGIRRLRRCPASFLPPEPADGTSVMAGLFAGGIMRRIEGEDWIELPATAEIITLLDGWTVLHRPSRTFRGRQFIMVPPFYGVLFVDALPVHSMAGLMSVEKPALCPLLPAVYWDLVLRKKHMPVIPFTGALPFSFSRRTFRRRGWKRDDLHLRGLELGINGVDRRLKGRMAAWFGAQCRLKGAAGQ